VAYYPAFNLNALFGVQAAMPNRIFTAPAEAWSLGPSAVLNIFDGGGRDALNDLARASYEQAVGAIPADRAQCLWEVEDNLASLHLLAREIATQQSAVAAAADSTSQATHLYSGGLDSYYSVILAQNIELTARLTEVDIETRLMTADVGLMKALGGGWERKDGLQVGRGEAASN
jgi:outer membrane protein, multidrug efflux system